MPRLPVPCARCGEPARVKYCSNRCSALATSKRIRSADDPRSRRWDRIKDAPGLTPYAIQKLGRKWRRQGRRCTYCDAPGTTVDHVLPLARGGTNHEGNLTPCCKACNSRKAGLTVIEWRTGLRLAPMTETLDSMGRRRPQRAPKPPKPRPVCAVCSEDCPTGRRRYCSDRCATQANRDYMRGYAFERYRTAVGIPLDQPRRKYDRAA